MNKIMIIRCHQLNAQRSDHIDFTEKIIGALTRSIIYLIEST